MSRLQVFSAVMVASLVIGAGVGVVMAVALWPSAEQMMRGLHGQEAAEFLPWFLLCWLGGALSGLQFGVVVGLIAALLHKPKNVDSASPPLAKRHPLEGLGRLLL